jgi:hypothetical protein
MIELKKNRLVFSFPDVHQEANLTMEFQRTLRIPDDGTDYLLPPGLGAFPLRHVDDYAQNVPESWIEHGGVMLPMYQSEAMWIAFGFGYGVNRYPFAVKIATGKINAVTGKEWQNGLNRRPQDYVVVPEQPWLDGYCVEKGVIRQFVAMPLGAGYSVEEQLTGEAEYGGIQIIAYPMKREAYERIKDRWSDAPVALASKALKVGSAKPFAMGLAPGGRMRQNIYDDTFKFEDWELEHSSRCFVHIANALVWRAITGKALPTVPPTAKEYTKAGLPWFDLYDGDKQALEGAKGLKGIKSVLQFGKEKGDVPLPENETVDPKNVVMLRHGLRKDQVREGAF